MAARLAARTDLVPCAASAVLLALLFFLAVPPARFPGGLSVAVYARRGELLGAAVSSSGQWRLPASKRGSGLPMRFVRSLVAWEDRRFFEHSGVDPAALLRALLQNARAGRIVSGGSTISMQVARLGRPGSDRVLGEKALEAFMALRFELLRGKRGILELYAQNAPFGGNVIGIEAASFRFFGRAPDSLSWAEAATLAVLPNAPSAAHPGKNRELLQSKRDRLLRFLAGSGEMGEEDLELALGEPLPPEPYPLPRLAPQLVDRFAQGGPPASVATTIDASLQERAAGILERRIGRLAAGGVYNGACLIASVDSGEVLAYVANVTPPRGEGDFALAVAHGEAVDMIRAERSSGSLFKPFLYAAALEAGELGPRSLLPDVPTRYGSYAPENNLGSYSGAVRADEALVRSLNVPFVRLLRSYGVERFRDLLASTGMTSLRRRAEDYGLTLILGGAETSLWEISGRFAALARSAAESGAGASARGGKASGGVSGQFFDLGLTKAELAARIRRPDPFSEGSAALTLEALTKVARPEEEAAWEDFASSRRIAWKTGTSFGFRDAWAVGVDGNFVVGVWAGNASGEGRPSIKGSAAAAPILFELFGLLTGTVDTAVDDTGPAEMATLRETEVCSSSGWAAGLNCGRSETALVPVAAKGLPLCPYCVSVALSADGRYRVRAGDEAPGSVRIEKRFVLPPAMEKYFARSLAYKSLPPWRPALAAARGEGSARSSSGDIAILAPEEGASLYIPVEITGKAGAAIFTAAHRDPGALLFWHLDGKYLGSTRGAHSIEARPNAGGHALTVVDASGRSVTRRFVIMSGT